MKSSKRINMLDEHLYKEFSTKCKENGYKIGYILDKIVTEWLNEQEEK